MGPLTLAEARALLNRYAVAWGRPELHDLAERLRKRPSAYPVARARRKSLDASLAQELRDYKAAHPYMSNQEIGKLFNVDGARVSEAVHYVDKKRKRGVL